MNEKINGEKIRKPKDGFRDVAACGFCQHYGKAFDRRKPNPCSACLIRQIFISLEEINCNLAFEHNHKYRKDSEWEIHNCVHCEHALIEDGRFYAPINVNLAISCALDEGKVKEGEYWPNHDSRHCCESWQRAVSREVIYKKSTPPEDSPCAK